MSDADLSARVGRIRQLGSVVRAVTGIAGARARSARTQIAAVEGYAAVLDAALSQGLAGVTLPDVTLTARPAALPSRSASLPKFADRLLAAMFARSDPRPISVVHTIWKHGQTSVDRSVLFPLPPATGALPQAAPLANLPADDLAAALGLDRLRAGLARAALHAFVSENEARMAAMSAMSAASRQIEDE